jgi:nucleolar pre-ribosomal-associated protein 1
MTAITLARGLQKLQVVQQLLADIAAEVDHEPSTSKESPWSRVRRELEFEARRRVPEVIIVINFAQQSAQLAPSETETEEEQALAAKSTLLTEAALRLFGLLYRTLPSIAAVAKFDVGRLLVSSSSAKAEKRERMSVKSGSVVDDSGSIASFGTAGTAGMGGGFGYSRGEVMRFDALSQVHVLALLRDVKEWDWARKAGRSYPITISRTHQLIHSCIAVHVLLPYPTAAPQHPATHHEIIDLIFTRQHASPNHVIRA